MTVYVDEIMTIMPRNKVAAKYGNRWCHMWSDDKSLAELHSMARKIGVCLALRRILIIRTMILCQANACLH